MRNISKRDVVRIKPKHHISRICMYLGDIPQDGILYFGLYGDQGFLLVGICDVEADEPKPYNRIIDVYGPTESVSEELLKAVEKSLGVETLPLSQALENWDRLVEREHKRDFKYN